MYGTHFWFFFFSKHTSKLMHGTVKMEIILYFIVSTSQRRWLLTIASTFWEMVPWWLPMRARRTSGSTSAWPVTLQGKWSHLPTASRWSTRVSLFVRHSWWHPSSKSVMISRPLSCSQTWLECMQWYDCVLCSWSHSRFGSLVSISCFCFVLVLFCIFFSRIMSRKDAKFPNIKDKD